MGEQGNFIRLSIGFVLVCSAVILTEVAWSQSEAGRPLDVMFVLDLSGSMGEELDAVKKNSISIMGRVASLTGDAHFGVAGFIDYASKYRSFGYAAEYGAPGDYPWRLIHELSADTDSIARSLLPLRLGNGKDGPEAYVRALYECVHLPWRPKALKVVVVFGDAPAHDDDLFSQSYGTDPGRDGAASTADDLDYQTVAAQLREAGILVVSIDGGSSDDSHLNFSYMAAQTGGYRFLLKNAEQVPDAILGLLEEAVEAETFVWQRVKIEDSIAKYDPELRQTVGLYEVSVNALRKPEDSSTWVYPSLMMNAEGEDYPDPNFIEIRDHTGKLVEDLLTARVVLSYARNAALYRSWIEKEEDPIPFHREGDNILEQRVTDEEWTGEAMLGVPVPVPRRIGNTDTSFGHSYPGWLWFPRELHQHPGPTHIVDWQDTLLMPAPLPTGIPYTLSRGVGDYDSRVRIYKSLIGSYVTGEGLKETEVKQQLWDLFLQASGTVDTANQVVSLAGGPGVDITQIAIRDVLSAVTMSKKDLDQWAHFLHTQSHYTGLATKFAPIISALLDTVELLDSFSERRLTMEQTSAFLLWLSVQEDGLVRLQTFRQALQVDALSGCDPALVQAIQEAGAELMAIHTSLEKVIRDANRRGDAERVLNVTKVALDTIIVIGIVTAPTGVGAVVAVAAKVLRLGIGVIELALWLVEDKTDYEDQLRALSLNATLEHAYFDKPIRNFARSRLRVDPVRSSDLDFLNGAVSTKIVQGYYFSTHHLRTEGMHGFIHDLLRDAFAGPDWQMHKSQLAQDSVNLYDTFYGIAGQQRYPYLCGIQWDHRGPTREWLGFVPDYALDQLLAWHSRSSSVLMGRELVCALHSPADILLIDPAGRRAGTLHTAAGRKMIAEIPGCTYTGPDTEPEELRIRRPLDGDYRVLLTPTGSGDCELRFGGSVANVPTTEASHRFTVVPDIPLESRFRLASAKGSFRIEAKRPEPVSGRIHGQVLSAETSQPLPEATLRIPEQGLVTVTDHNGNYVLSDVPIGRQMLHVDAAAFVASRAEVHVTPGGVERSFRMSRQNEDLAVYAIDGGSGTIQASWRAPREVMVSEYEVIVRSADTGGRDRETHRDRLASRAAVIPVQETGFYELTVRAFYERDTLLESEPFGVFAEVPERVREAPSRAFSGGFSSTGGGGGGIPSNHYGNATSRSGTHGYLLTLIVLFIAVLVAVSVLLFVLLHRRDQIALRALWLDNRRLILKKRRTAVGSGEHCDIILRDASVSRQHALIERRPDGYYIRDLESRNGTWVNGHRIRGPVRLQQNNTVSFGRVSAVVGRRDAAPSTQAHSRERKRAF